MPHYASQAALIPQDYSLGGGGGFGGYRGFIWLISTNLVVDLLVFLVGLGDETIGWWTGGATDLISLDLL